MVLTTTPQSGYLLATAEGPFSLEDAQKQFLQLLDQIEQQGNDKVLFDGRKVTGEPTALERYLYGEFAAMAAAGMIIPQIIPAQRFAYVLNRPVLDPRRLGEITARNRAMDVKAFENVDDALKWLLAQ